VALEGTVPFARIVIKEFGAALPDVRAYLGTPSKNSSGVTFPEAVLIWEHGKDWSGALAGIPIDPGASRFARETDSIPLRSEQLRAVESDLQELCKLHDEGILRWQ